MNLWLWRARIENRYLNFLYIREILILGNLTFFFNLTRRFYVKYTNAENNIVEFSFSVLHLTWIFYFPFQCCYHIPLPSATGEKYHKFNALKHQVVVIVYIWNSEIQSWVPLGKNQTIGMTALFSRDPGLESNFCPFQVPIVTTTILLVNTVRFNNNNSQLP